MPRSGGFATLDVGQLTTESRLLTDLLMFIGGGSGSTAGGIRVTTFALLMLSIWAEIRGNPDVEVFGRRIPHDTIRQAIGVLVMSATIDAEKFSSFFNRRVRSGRLFALR